jgi:hypothetical protein
MTKNNSAFVRFLSLDLHCLKKFLLLFIPKFFEEWIIKLKECFTKDFFLKYDSNQIFFTFERPIWVVLSPLRRERSCASRLRDIETKLSDFLAARLFRQSLNEMRGTVEKNRLSQLQCNYIFKRFKLMLTNYWTIGKLHLIVFETLHCFILLI